MANAYELIEQMQELDESIAYHLDLVKYHMERAAEVAAERYGRGYAHEFVSGYVEDIWATSTLPPARTGYRKHDISHYLAKKVFERDKYRCRRCKTWLDLTCDHIIPESKGGATTFDNLQTLCRRCNSSKGRKV